MTAIEKKTAENKERFLAAFEKKAGNVRAVCVAVGIPRSTYYFWRSLDPDFAGAVADALEDIKDNIEFQLMLIGIGVKQGSVIALLGWLNARAKDRGYGTSKIEGGGKLSFVVVAAGDPAPGSAVPRRCSQGGSSRDPLGKQLAGTSET
jgi:hypothetical protein